MRWLVLVLWVLGTVAPARAQVHAIVIGNNAPPQGVPGLSTLRYADDDAVRLFQLLRRASPDAVLLTELDDATARRYPLEAEAAQPPTLRQLRRTLRRVRKEIASERKRGQQPTVFLTFSGHGSIGEAGEPYLSLRDGRLTRSRLHDEVLASLRDAQVHLIVDACHGGAVVGVRGAFDHEQEAQTVALGPEQLASLVHNRSLSRFDHVGALIATAADQRAHEWSHIESGVFTHQLASALLGAADVNGDLKVEYSEVEAFVAAANRDMEDPRARAQLVSQPPRRRAQQVLLDLTKLERTRWLYGEASELGRFYIELENGQRLLEANVRDQRLALALPRQHRAYIRAGDREAVIGVRARAAVRFGQLRFGSTSLASRGALEHSLRERLFRTPFDGVYYKGYVDSRNLLGVRFSGPRPVPGAAPEPPRDRRTTRRARTWGIVGATLALGAGGAVALSMKAKKDFDDTEFERTAHDAERRFRRAGYAAIGLAGASLLTSGAAVWIWLKPEERRTSAGLGVRGRF